MWRIINSGAGANSSPFLHVPRLPTGFAYCVASRRRLPTTLTAVVKRIVRLCRNKSALLKALLRILRRAWDRLPPSRTWEGSLRFRRGFRRGFRRKVPSRREITAPLSFPTAPAFRICRNNVVVLVRWRTERLRELMKDYAPAQTTK